MVVTSACREVVPSFSDGVLSMTGVGAETIKEDDDEPRLRSACEGVVSYVVACIKKHDTDETK